MKIKDRPEFTSKPKVLTMGPDTSVRDAACEMSRLNYGSVIVTDAEDKMLGIVTERDLMKRLVAENRDPDQTCLRDIMTRDLKVARADDRVIDWLRQMSNDRFRRLPIVDEDGKAISMMTQGDFVSYTWPELLGQLGFTAKAAMGANSQFSIMVAGVLIYSLALIGILV